MRYRLHTRPLEERSTDILVIGAGPAGLAAALAGRRCGASVVVLDERPQSGGQYYKGIASSHQTATPPDKQFHEGSVLIEDVRSSGVSILQEVTVWGAFAANEVLALVAGEAIVFRPRRLVLATGAYERAMPIPGWTLPGVMTTGAAQTLMRSYQVTPGRRVVVAGNGPLDFQLAADMVAMGIEVVAVAETASRPGLGLVGPLLRAALNDPLRMIEGGGYLRRLRSAGVPILWGHIATAAKGEGRVSEVVLSPVDTDGAFDPAQGQSFPADALCLGYGLIASSEIANALGCRMRLDPRHLGSLAVDTTEAGETSIAGVFAVGDGASVLWFRCGSGARRDRRQGCCHTARICKRAGWRCRTEAPDSAAVPRCAYGRSFAPRPSCSSLSPTRPSSAAAKRWIWGCFVAR